MAVRLCACGCGQATELADRRPTGLSSRCKTCLRAWRSDQYAANRDAELAKSAAQWRQDPARRERHLQIARDSYYRDLEQTRARKRNNHENRRGRLLDQFIEDVDAEIVYLRDGGICGICLLPVARTAFHIDHVIPLALGGLHCYANVQLAHPSCNLSKGARLTGEGV